MSDESQDVGEALEEFTVFSSSDMIARSTRTNPIVTFRLDYVSLCYQFSEMVKLILLPPRYREGWARVLFIFTTDPLLDAIAHNEG